MHDLNDKASAIAAWQALVNINPNAAAAVAGTSRAAARGGDSDNQATESTRQQSAAEKPAGKATDSSALDAGDHAEDRHGDGRQMLDVFEPSEQAADSEDQPTSPESSTPASPDGSGEHLDLQA